MKSEKCKLNGTSACAETALNETERFAKACGTVQWSFSQYIASENPDLKAEQWDELERSVLSNLADDIRIGVRDRDVFITVCWSDDEVWSMLKKLKKQMEN